ncbi:hypothetical protein D9D59_26750 [Escherichia coli]|nr:hypothetical protein [Escherichia coli]EEW2271198.1 hypothetical protein [Escherichia coli]EFN8571521.1 hypothetical protein [Escherichia coli O85:H32]EFO0015812.1 hypothetical protein [Escherichia coli]HAJ7015417.1 hypothetical protein [Escherichia coli]
MTTFAVVLNDDDEKLVARINEIFPKECVFQVDSRLILIHSEKTMLAKEIFEKIDTDGAYRAGDVVNFVIFSISSYYGIHYTSMWEWLEGRIK